MDRDKLKWAKERLEYLISGESDQYPPDYIREIEIAIKCIDELLNKVETPSDRDRFGLISGRGCSDLMFDTISRLEF